MHVFLCYMMKINAYGKFIFSVIWKYTIQANPTRI